MVVVVVVWLWGGCVVVVLVVVVCGGGVVVCGVVWCGVVWCGVVWCGVVWCGVVWCGVVVVCVVWWWWCVVGCEWLCGGGSDGAVNERSVDNPSRNASNYGGHVPVDMTPLALCLCTGPQKDIPSLHVSVVKQRWLDLIDELQLRRSTVFCTSIPDNSRAQQRACQHPCPRKDTGCCATADNKPAR